jgi:hypothetical protein
MVIIVIVELIVLLVRPSELSCFYLYFRIVICLDGVVIVVLTMSKFGFFKDNSSAN